jgi:methylthioribose-1-phosphate isomerase
MKFKTIEWKNDRIRLLDQRKLPREVRYVECRDASTVAEAIRNMTIRGAPAIGVAAAMGIALAAKKVRSRRPEVFGKAVGQACQLMKQTRPTAVNLFWAVNRMESVCGQTSSDVEEMKAKLAAEALRIYEEDIDVNRRIGQFGKDLVQDGKGVITHCNAGGLATAEYGTALGVIRAAWGAGKRFHVFVDETRPMCQGARLTAWELVQEKIPATVLTDNMAAWLMKKKEIALALVGADRIARNGDTANKIGTYGLAIVAHWHDVPFYVASPISTLDLSLESGERIPIEERASQEVTHFYGKRITPEGVGAFNPSFDVTPYALIEGIITENGIARKPFARNLKGLTRIHRRAGNDSVDLPE